MACCCLCLKSGEAAGTAVVVTGTHGAESEFQHKLDAVYPCESTMMVVAAAAAVVVVVVVESGCTQVVLPRLSTCGLLVSGLRPCGC